MSGPAGDAPEFLAIAKRVLRSVLGIDAAEAADGGAAPSLVGRVTIDGMWTGTIELACTLPMARLAAAIMHQTDLMQVSEREMRDALAELTNILGGNFKARLPGPSRLSLPAVAADTGAERTVPGDVQWRTTLASKDGRAVITLYRREEEAA